jgi:hypothetical protein
VACANTTCGPNALEIASIWIIAPPLYGVPYALRNLRRPFVWAAQVFQRRLVGKSVSLKWQAAFASAQKGAYIGSHVFQEARRHEHNEAQGGCLAAWA